MYSTSKQKQNKIQKPSIKKILVIGILIAVFFAATAVVLEKSGVTNFYQRTPAPSAAPQDPQPTINLGPPTDEEAAAGDQQKEEIVKDETAPTPTTPTTTANVVIVDASQYDTEVEVRAFASNVIKDGTCSFTFKKSGESTIEKSVPAYADASSSPCIALTMARSDFPSGGNWQLTVKYTSEGIEGSAETSLQLQ